MDRTWEIEKGGDGGSKIRDTCPLYNILKLYLYIYLFPYHIHIKVFFPRKPRKNLGCPHMTIKALFIVFGKEEES